MGLFAKVRVGGAKEEEEEKRERGREKERERGGGTAPKAAVVNPTSTTNLNRICNVLVAIPRLRCRVSAGVVSTPALSVCVASSSPRASNPAFSVVAEFTV
jgi:hypothetical protein